MKKLTRQAFVALTTVSLLAGCGASSSSSNAQGADRPTTSDTSTPAQSADAVVAGSAENVEHHTDADSFQYDDTSVVGISLGAAISATSDAVSIEGTTATITSEGTYDVSGTLTDGQIIVDADDAVVQIILDGADITNTDGAAIAVLNAETAIVILADGSSNTLTDGDLYVFAEGEDEPNAALFSKTDLTVGGTGSLTVTGNYNDGIASKDGLVIDSGTITVDAIDDGIRGKDYVVIQGGTIDITAGGDGIKSDDDEDPERGYISIADGAIAVTSSDDGLQATTDVLITGGTLDVTAGRGDDASDAARGIQGDVMVAISGGSITADAADDAIHSNSTVTIDDGDLTLASGDDGIHGDLFVTIDGGAILITESFEGIESEVVTINDGNIDITSSDDGVNVASADAATTVDTAAQPAPNTDDAIAQPPVDDAGRPARVEGGGRGGGGAGGDAEVGEFYVYINGGTLAITIAGDLAEQGDGIDANGHVEMTGGVVAVSGPTDTRNSAIDYSGGSFTMTGGIFIGTNINGRNSEGIGAGSSQPSVYVALDSVVEAGTLIHIQASGGEGQVTFEAANQFDVVVFGSPDLVAGEVYEIYVGGSGSGESSAGLYDTYTPGVLVGNATAVLE